MGMSCPTGLTWRAASAAMRAGISRRADLCWRDNSGQPIVGSRLPQLDDRTSAQVRWRQLLCWSMAEALAPVERSQRAHVPVVLVVPEACVDSTPPPPLAALCAAQGLSPERLLLINGNSAAGLRALSTARALLAAHPWCLVAAADSLLGARPLLRLLEQQRLLTPDNPDGVTPGEAAAAVLLSPSGPGALAQVFGIGWAQEPGLPDNDVPLRAAGICAAARGALLEAGLSMHDMAFRVSDAAGDSYAFKEQALMLSRLLQTPRARLDLLLPAETLGDVGMAAGLCGLVFAIYCLNRAGAAEGAGLVFGGGRDGARAAVVVGVPHSTGGRDG